MPILLTTQKLAKRLRTSLLNKWHYFLPVLLNTVLVLRWFDTGKYIGAGDVSPLIRNNLRSEAFSTWGHQLTGAGGTRNNTGRSIETLLIRFVEFFGGDTLAAQQLLFILVAAICSIGVAHTARLLLTNKAAIAAAAALAFVNPFVMLYLPNLIFPLALGTIGLLIGELVGLLLGHRSTIFRLALCTLPIAYLSVNPPLIVVTVGSTLLAMVVAGLYRRQEAKRLVVFVLKAIAPITILHLWWIVPTALLFAAGGPAGVSFAAETSDTGWKWVNAQNDLDRIATLTAHWGWDQYKPYSATLDSAPWVFMRWVLPLGAFCGLLFLLASRKKNQRMLGIALAISGASLLAIAQGLHGTFERFNLFLFENVPGWWLFRDPASKFGPLLTLVYILLFGFLLEKLWTSRRPMSISARPAASLRFFRPLFLCLGIAATGLAIAHPYPILTGEVISASDRGTLPPSRVSVPSDWEEIHQLVKASPAKGKVAVFPINNYYQVTTTWGYHGVDLANQFFSQPVIQSYPGGYFQDKQPFTQQFEALRDAIESADSLAVNRLSKSLGASHLVIRKDTTHDARRLTLQAPRLSDVTQIHSSDIADVYEIDDFGLIDVATQWTNASTADTISAIDAAGDPVLDRAENGARHPSHFFWQPSLGNDNVSTVVSSETTIAEVTKNYLDIEETAYSWKLLNRPELVINNKQLENRLVAEITKDADTKKYIVANGRAQALQDQQEVAASEGHVTILTASKPAPLVVTHTISDCNNVGKKPLPQVAIDSEITQETVTLTAAEHTACTILDVPRSEQETVIEFSVQQVHNGLGRVCLWNHDTSLCEFDQKFTSTTQDKPVMLLAQPSDSRRSLYLHASFEEEAGSPEAEAQYSFPQASIVEEKNVVAVETTSTHTIETPNGKAELRSTSADSNLLGEFGFLQDCHKHNDLTFEEAGLAIERHSNGVTLSAEKHSACVSAPVTANPGAEIDLAFDFDTTRGTAKPRFCLWQEIINACIADGVIREADYESNRYAAKVTLGESSGEALLFFYADSLEMGTEISYTNVSVTEDTSPDVYLHQGSPSQATLSVVSEKLSSDRYRATITLDGQKTLVTLPESYDDKWQLEVPQGWASEQVKVNDYANGWFVSGEGEGTVTMTYQPSIITSWVQKASLVIALALLVNFLFSTALRIVQIVLKQRRRHLV